jgi:hypothetical protein
VTGGYPNEAVFWGSDLAMSTREKRLDINPIVRKARMAEHCDIVPFRMIGDTRIECRCASSQRKSTRFEPTGSNRRGAPAGKPGRVRLAWTDHERSADFDNSKHHAAQEPRWFAGLIFS